jgi:hypothetical protein
MSPNPSLTEHRAVSQAGKINAIQRKVFSRKDGDPLTPQFTNAINFSVLMNDVFMDVGCITPEAVGTATEDRSAAGQPDDAPTPVNVIVEHRFAMSLTTVMGMHQQLSLLIAQAMGQTSQQVQQSPPDLAPGTLLKEG